MLIAQKSSMESVDSIRTCKLSDLGNDRKGARSLFFELFARMLTLHSSGTRPNLLQLIT